MAGSKYTNPEGSFSTKAVENTMNRPLAMAERIKFFAKAAGIGWLNHLPCCQVAQKKHLPPPVFNLIQTQQAAAERQCLCTRLAGTGCCAVARSASGAFDQTGLFGFFLDQHKEQTSLFTGSTFFTL